MAKSSSRIPPFLSKTVVIGWFPRSSRERSVESAARSYLETISDYVLPVSIRRRTLFRWALIPSRHELRGSFRWILCDENAGKAISAHELLGISLAVVNPTQCPRSARLRALALLYILCSKPRREIAWAQLLSKAFIQFRYRQCPESQVFLWNPFHLIHYAVAFREARVAVYHLNCAYPRVPHARWVFGSALSLKVLSYGPHVSLVVVGPKLTRVEEKPRLVLCPSKLAVVDQVETERFLLDLGEWTRVKYGFPVWVFLHPNDRRAVGESAFLRSRLQSQGLTLSEERYESRVSHSDVSISALSTLGTELISRGLAHHVLVQGTPHAVEIRGDWRGGAGTALSASGSVVDIRFGLEACATEVVSLLAQNRSKDGLTGPGLNRGNARNWGLE